MNRRLRHVVERNILRLARPFAEVSVQTRQIPRIGARGCWDGVLIGNEFEISVTDKHKTISMITISQCGFVTLESRHIIIIEAMLKMPESCWKSTPYHPVDTYTFQAQSQEDGVKYALSVIFRHFFIGLTIKHESINADWTKRWYPLISEAYRHSDSNGSSFILVEKEQPGLRELVATLECDNLKIETSGRLREVLPYLTIWDHQLTITCMAYGWINPIVDLVKKWMTGECSIRNAEIKNGGDGSDNMTEIDLEMIGRELKSDSQPKSNETNDKLVISFDRPLDSSHLFISLSRENGNIRIFERK